MIVCPRRDQTSKGQAEPACLSGTAAGMPRAAEVLTRWTSARTPRACTLRPARVPVPGPRLPQAHVGRKYEAIVLRPALTDPELHRAFVRSLQSAHREYLAAVSGLEASVAAFVSQVFSEWHCNAPSRLARGGGLKGPGAMFAPVGKVRCRVVLAIGTVEHSGTATVARSKPLSVLPKGRDGERLPPHAPGALDFERN